MSKRRKNGVRALAALGLMATVLVAPTTAPVSAGETIGAPVFLKTFAPDTIGPGSVSTLTFTIDNTANALRDGLGFSDTLPAGMTIADPTNASTTCSPNGAVGPTLSAPAGGATITFSDGGIGAGQTCFVTVDVTSSTAGAATNTSTGLTFNGGGTGSATDDLTVDATLPGFTKDFSPSSVSVGARSTLTLTIDNTANTSAVPNLDFTDTLPPGMTVASPANASSTCGTPTVPPVITAVPGSSSVTLDANGTVGFPALAAFASCTVTVDVVTSAVGSLINSTELLADSTTAGKATAALEVTGSDLAITKEFTDDPVPPGGAVTLDFTISNNSRTDAATAVAFTDALPASAVFDSLLSNTCGGSVAGLASSTITFTGGAVAAEGSCTISTSLSIPAGTTPGTFVNTTSTVTGTVGGSSVTGNTASDTLFVVSYPALTVEFIGDPVGAGDTVTLRYTIANTSAAGAMTDIEFTDELTDGSGGFPPDPTSGFLPFPVTAATVTPDPPCGAGSSFALVAFNTDREALSFSGGSLAAAPGAGASCTFDVVVTVPAGFAAGTYVNHTEEVSGVVGGNTMVGPAASDSLVVVAAPTLRKEFTDDPVNPGDSVNLRFTLEHADTAPGNATSIAFTDNLSSTLAGLTATAVAGNTCGATVDISTNTNIAVSGGTMVPGATCTIDVTLAIPAGATPGSHTNTTSTLTATVLGVTATEPAASDDLQIAALVLTKEFVENPYIAGETATLRFTLNNQSASAATGIGFSDSLADILPATPDISAPGPLDTGTCDGTLTGTATLSYSGGSLAAGTTCTFDVSVLIPVGAPEGTFSNITSGVSSNLGTSDPATADLTIDATLIGITKEFTDDPVAPNGVVTLAFNLTNLSPTKTITDIVFADNLGAALTGLTATGATGNTCGGMASSTFPTTSFAYSGGTLAGGATCTVTLTLTVPPGPFAAHTYTNTTSAPSGKVGTLDVNGDPASDDLEVRIQTLTKSFDGPTSPTGTADLSFTITNLDSANAVNGLSFSDNLDAMMSGLVATTLPSTPCGAGSAITGTSFLSLTSGNLAASGSCTFVVTVTVPGNAAAGVYNNTTSDLFSSGLSVDDPATASLTVAPQMTVTINQATGQADPTNTAPINFTVIFDQAVTGFDAADVAVVNGTVASVTAAGVNTFTVAVTPTAEGLVTATVPAGGAVDANGTANVASTSTDNSVNYDTTNPVINTPPSITVNNDPGAAGAVVNYVVTTTDEGTTTGTSGGDFSARLLAEGESAQIVLPGGLVCTPPSGAFFPIGTTPVTCTSTDAAGNVTTQVFNVIVVDNEDPVIAAAPNVTHTITSGAAGPVTFPTPTATDNSGSVTVTCVPASGSNFGIGVTTVTCTAADAAGNSAASSFSVTVDSSELLPATGGGLDGLTLALQFLLVGLGLVAIARLNSRRRLRVR